MRKVKQKRPLGTTNSQSDKFVLRLPDGMRVRIGTAAAAAGRSMNAEIIDALEKHLKLDFDLLDALNDADNRLSRLESDISALKLHLGL